uniref:BTB/POZ domain-containing protein At5g47800 isoform X2 n=1 Tax=Fragaria vesca subsp. vesca TaxID=101020 RepID=UPI0005CAA8EA|nr:PREDICTED: BTB/POZ domain-containing protein At5g47800 isoform X2 [Fragaria vesca subsp. vesca]
MKFMKIGTKPDTFYTERATRSVASDVPSDLLIQINNVSYLLHKLQFPLLPKCGLLQQLCCDSGGPEKVNIELHDIPGGEEAFELCAKFCYGIKINLSAYNIVPAYCAAKFLGMTESVEKGNFVLKLEAFLNSCILEGWKDSIITLQSTVKLPDWSENLGIIRKCIDSIVEKILTPPPKVTWSYTYTRPGYNKKHHHPVPKDWWTEDISDLDIDLFRCIVTAVRSTYMLPPQLIGEALHVYACRWLPDTTNIRPPLDQNSDSNQDETLMEKNRRIVDNIASMIPGDQGSVSVGFLLRLLNIANYLGGVSPVTKTELLRRSSLQLEEATVNDLLIPSHSPTDPEFYDIDLVLSLLQSFLMRWKRQSPAAAAENSHHFFRTIRKVGKIIDSYLQVVATDANMPVSKMATLAEALPDIAREDHDDIYKAINIYLKEHSDLSKADKKRLCRILDCQKLSPEVRAHAVKNERLPLRIVVQVLFFEQERGSNSKAAVTSHRLPDRLVGQLSSSGKQTSTTSRSEDHAAKLRTGGDDEKLSMGKGTRRTNNAVSESTNALGTRGIYEQRKRSEAKSAAEIKERKAVKRGEIQEVEEVDLGREIRELGIISAGSKLDAHKMINKGSRSSDHGRDKAKDR